MARVTLNIPIKPYLAKFLQEELATSSPVIEIDANSIFGAYLMGLVRPSPTPQKVEGHHYIELQIPEQDRLGLLYDGRCQHLSINKHNIGRFNQLLEELFNYRLFHTLEQLEETGQANRRGGRKKEIINNVIEKYSEVGGELTYGMLKMRHDRWKKSGKSLIQTALTNIS